MIRRLGFYERHDIRPVQVHRQNLIGTTATVQIQEIFDPVILNFIGVFGAICHEQIKIAVVPEQAVRLTVTYGEIQVEIAIPVKIAPAITVEVSP